MLLNAASLPDTVLAGPWRARRSSGELSGPGGTQRLEPKVMDLLCLLAAEPGRVWSKDQLSEALWPGLVLGEDSLARTVSKLRQALGDDARAPRWVETIAKRGYRWLPEPVAAAVAAPGGSAGDVAGPAPEPLVPDPPRDLRADTPGQPAGLTRLSARQASRWLAGGLLLTAALAGALAFLQGRQAPAPASANESSETARLLARADDFYFQFSRGDNEAALELYQRVLGMDPDQPSAQAGLANALAQRAIRWPSPPGAGAVEHRNLGEARRAGHLELEPAVSLLKRARQLAESSVARAPRLAAAHKALGLVASAQGDLVRGLAAHRQAVELDAQAWGAMINLADVLELLGRPEEALPWLERAYAAMDAEYARTPVHVQRWQQALGVLVAERHSSRGAQAQAEAWYRRVLVIAPLHPQATRGLVTLLAQGGDRAAAERLCQEMQQRLGTAATCDAR